MNRRKKRIIKFKRILNGYSSVAASGALSNLVVRNMRVTQGCHPLRKEDPCNTHLNAINSYFSLSVSLADTFLQLINNTDILELSKDTQKNINFIWQNFNDIAGMAGSTLWFSLFAITEYSISFSRFDPEQEVIISDNAYHRILLGSIVLAVLSNNEVRKLIRKGMNLQARDAILCKKTADMFFGFLKGFMRGRNFIGSIQTVLNMVYETQQYIYSFENTVVRLSLSAGWGLFSGFAESYYSPESVTTDLVRLTAGGSKAQILVTFCDALFNSFFYTLLTVQSIEDQPAVTKNIIISLYALITIIIPLIHLWCEQKETEELDQTNAEDLPIDEKMIANSDIESDVDSKKGSPHSNPNRFFTQDENAINDGSLKAATTTISARINK